MKNNLRKFIFFLPIKIIFHFLVILFLFPLIIIFGLSKISLAMPAAPDIFEIVQPDGHLFKARAVGDEWNNRVETRDGYSVKKGNDNFWYYILNYDKDVPVLGSTRAHRIPAAGLKKHIRPEKKFMRLSPEKSGRSAAGTGSSVSVASGPSETPGASPPYGTFNGKILFILAEFTDISGTYSESSFASFISDNLNNYFNKASYSNVSLTPANETFGTANNGVVGWVNVGYLHPDTGGSTDTRNQQLTKDAIVAADSYVDFSAFDTNSDGYVDADELAVVVIAAGYETSYDGGVYTPTVWGHKWSIGSFVGAPAVDGVIVGHYHSGTGGYAQFGEIHRSTVSNAHQATMGIMVHELGHLIFGLSDLYDTDGSSQGIGAFGIMSSGSWGRAASDTYSGETPVLPCAWTKYNRGWAIGSVGSGSTSITAAGSTSATDSNTVYRLPISFPNEYFMVENRQPSGYDRGLERWLGAGFGGLAIWHIDESRANNTQECFPPVDCTSVHFKVSLEQADSLWDLEKDINRGNATDLWYPGNAATFDAASVPDSNLYSGNLSNVSVTDISASGSVMTATLTNGILSADPDGPHADTEGQAIILDGSGSSGGIVLYEWDIDNDGVYDYSSSLPTRSHIYTQQGTYTIRLRVTDNLSATDEATTTADISDTLPSASFEASPLAGTEPLTINVTDTSTAYDGVASQSWDFGDGSPEGSGSSDSHIYIQNGVYIITLTVTDSDGSTDTAIDAITINDTSPTVDFTVSPTNGTAPLTVDLTNSSTGYDTPLTYEWDFDNDGTIDSTAQSPSHVYNIAGMYTVKLTVTDSDGSANSLTKTDYITACNLPVRITDVPPVYYSTLQAAYNAAGEGDTIQSHDVIFTEDLNIDLNKSVTLDGGYDCDYSAITGETTLNGIMTISNGTVEIEDFILE